MKDYFISGIQQMGIGVHDVYKSWEYYRKTFGMDCRIFEEEAEASLMLPFTDGKPRKRHAVLALNLQSGGGFEIWQHTGKQPEDPKEDTVVGDLGILFCKMKVKNISEAIAWHRYKGTEVPGDPVEDPSGSASFFIRDPFGNIFQAVEADDWFMDEKKVSGGVYGAIIGVSDIEKSKVVYSDILGYDVTVYDNTGIFPDLAVVPGGDKKCRRVLLKRSLPFSGPFSRVLGNSVIELISASDGPGKRIYEGRIWGDPGFIHLCFDIRGMAGIRSYSESKGFPFLVDSMKSQSGDSFGMGEAAGHFSYLQDPDGTLIEFVEAHKLAILKKFGLYLNLRKRDPHAPLPDWMLRFLKFSRVKD
ncbi:MAG: VOC family protein [Bacteroidales bacterium]|nr:VOC family protein [Bacteroidales bacterium]